MEWISVNDRLPPAGRVYCAVVVVNPESGVMYYHIDRWEGSDFFIHNKMSGYRVTHWVPLPEPPEN